MYTLKENKNKYYILKKFYSIVSQILMPILAVLLSIILTLYLSQPDFNISLNNLEKTVEVGSVFQEELKVENTNKYDNYDVILKVINLPENVNISFSPKSQRLNSSFISNINFTIQENAKPGTYDIKFRGIGSTGLERTCEYELTITDF